MHGPLNAKHSPSSKKMIIVKIFSVTLKVREIELDKYDFKLFFVTEETFNE
jgi:hypothetical protein